MARAQTRFSAASRRGRRGSSRRPRRASAEAVAVEEASVDAPAAVAPAAVADEEDAGEDPIAELAWESTRAADTASPQYSNNYFRECLVCPDMATLPAGTTRLGAPPAESASRDVERPVLEASFPKGFAIGVREVTFDEWDACVAGGGCNAYRPSDSGWGRGARPVINVSYQDAADYVAWLSARTGARYRLPTEAEWEYAARAGTTTPFWFGASLSPRLANYHGEYPYGGAKGLYRKQTIRTGAFEPNPFGLFDVHGNVWEWTADCWSEIRAAAASVDGCPQRVVKGGAWNAGGWRLRSAHRQPANANTRAFDTGFRVVRELP